MTITASTRDERTFAEVRRLSTAGLEGTEMLRRVAERLRRSVPFEVYGASMVDPATNLMTYSFVEGLGEEGRARCGVYFDRVYFEETRDQFASMLREHRTVYRLSEITGGGLERSLTYREFLKPLGLAHTLKSVLVDGGAWGEMNFVRGADDPDFNDREVELVKRLAPHVGAGLKAATLRSQATNGQGNGSHAHPDIPGVLTLDRHGRVVSRTPSAERWLRELGDPGSTLREGSLELPIPVRMVANALKRYLDPRSERDLNLVPRTRVRARSGRWLALYGQLVEPTPQRRDETMIVIEPARSEEVAWLNVAAYGLSPREEEVVGLVARGLSNRQISRNLFISENTVQRHLSNIFEKVGVRGRRNLLKLLFFDNLLPGVTQN